MTTIRIPDTTLVREQTADPVSGHSRRDWPE